MIMKPEIIREPISPRSAYAIKTNTAIAMRSPGYRKHAYDQMQYKHCSGEMADQYLDVLPTVIDLARLYLWEPPLWIASVSGEDAFEGMKWTHSSDGSEYAPQLHMLTEGGFSFGMNDILELPTDHEYVCKYIISFVARDGDAQISWGLLLAFQPEISVGEVKGYMHTDPYAGFPLFRAVPPLPEGESIVYPYSPVKAMQEFLTLKIASVEHAKLPRPERRRMEKAGQKEPDIRVVRLRKSDKKQEGPVGEKHVDWKHRWIVKGHWRKQYYPSEGIHKRKYISEYLKGPDDKPLKPPKKTIYAVNK